MSEGQCCLILCGKAPHLISTKTHSKCDELDLKKSKLLSYRILSYVFIE